MDHFVVYSCAIAGPNISGSQVDEYKQRTLGGNIVGIKQI